MVLGTTWWSNRTMILKPIDMTEYCVCIWSFVFGRFCLPESGWCCPLIYVLLTWIVPLWKSFFAHSCLTESILPFLSVGMAHFVQKTELDFLILWKYAQKLHGQPRMAWAIFITSGLWHFWLIQTTFCSRSLDHRYIRPRCRINRFKTLLSLLSCFYKSFKFFILIFKAGPILLAELFMFIHKSVMFILLYLLIVQLLSHVSVVWVCVC